MGEHDGHNGLVTGAASGIGRAIALEVASQGAGVVALLDIDGQGLEATAALCEAAGARTVRRVVDVSDRDRVGAAVDEVVGEMGSLDFAVNNAAIMGDRRPLHELPSDAWDRLLAVNLTSVFLCMKAELAPMIAAGRGAIVNIASNAGLFGIGGMAGYVASKHGVVGLSKATAIDYGPYGIRVVALCPGSTATPMMTAELADKPDGVSNRTSATPLGRLGDPSEIASVASFLASDRASYVTGEWVRVDGGRRA